MIVTLLFFLLPVVSLMLVYRRRWLALLPLIGSLAIIVAWFLYYATDWFGPVSGGAGGAVFLLTLAGWVVVALAWSWGRRSPAPG